jgi:hypothetical protein
MSSNNADNGKKKRAKRKQEKVRQVGNAGASFVADGYQWRELDQTQDDAADAIKSVYYGLGNIDCFINVVVVVVVFGFCWMTAGNRVASI